MHKILQQKAALAQSHIIYQAIQNED